MLQRVFQNSTFSKCAIDPFPPLGAHINTDACGCARSILYTKYGCRQIVGEDYREPQQLTSAVSLHITSLCPVFYMLDHNFPHPHTRVLSCTSTCTCLNLCSLARVLSNFQHIKNMHNYSLQQRGTRQLETKFDCR